MKPILSAVAVAMLATAATPALADTVQAGKTRLTVRKGDEGKPQAERQYCRKVVVVGSRVPQQNCMTLTEWRAALGMQNVG